MIQMLLAQPLEDADLSSLRYVNSGAAPLAAETREQWERRVPGSEILEGYGCTESGAVISVNPPGASRPGSVGLPIPGYQVSIRDDDDADVPAGADGEICVRADGVMAGYWNSPAETAATLRGGWLHTGDIGRLDADGYLYVRGQEEGPHHPRRLQRLPARRGGRPAPAPGGRDGGRRRPAGRAAGRGDRGLRVAAAGQPGHPGGDHRVRPRAARGAQVPTRGEHRRRRCRSPASGSWTARPSAAGPPTETGDRGHLAPAAPSCYVSHTFSSRSWAWIVWRGGGTCEERGR